MLECRCHVLVQLLLQFMQVYAECYLVISTSLNLPLIYLKYFIFLIWQVDILLEYLA
jgi:hypothetical protein